MLRWISLLLMVCCMMACQSQAGMTPPAGWEVASAPQEAQADAAGAKMQVIICYAWFLSSHACLRIEGPGDERLFWDPGGGYGENNPAIVRRNDVMLDQSALSLEQVWQYRRINCSEPYMLVFEWSITPAQAGRRRAILTHQLRGSDGRVLFDADAPGGQCSVYLSDFLRRFCEETASLRGKRFWPHNLARQLWDCDPARVMLYKRRQVVTLYTRP